LWNSNELNPNGTRRNISRVLSFRLGGDAKLPEMPSITELQAPAADDFGSDEQVADGKVLYGRNCGGCHGGAAVGNGFMPDLRHSAYAATAEAWGSVILDGILIDKGMISFAEVLNEDDAESIRAFVMWQAHNPEE
jgi:mono/diheme cytochrome c family protein